MNQLRRTLRCMLAFPMLAAIYLASDANAQSDEDWRQKFGKFRVGVVGGNRPILKSRQVQPFREVLQKALGVPVEIFAARDHRTLIDAIAGSRIEYATFSATAFSAAWQSCKCVEPIAIPLAKDGSGSFRSVLLSRYLGPGSLEAVKKKTILVPGKGSFSGFLHPKAALVSKGIKLDTAEWPVHDMGSMQSAIEAFSKGKGDALLGWIPEVADRGISANRGTLQALVQLTGEPATQFRILWKSDPIPHGPHAVRRNLPMEVKELVWETLRDLNNKSPKAYDAIEPGLGGGFRRVAVSDYRPLTQILLVPATAARTK